MFFLLFLYILLTRYETDKLRKHLTKIIFSTVIQNSWLPKINQLCTFQGNDQIRFELTCYALYPEVKVSLMLLFFTWNNIVFCVKWYPLHLHVCVKSDHCTMEDPWILQSLQGENGSDGICTGNCSSVGKCQ